MDIVPKAELIDGAYYEGLTMDCEEGRVACWNAKADQFEFALHHWTDVHLMPMVYWDEQSEYFEAFQPVLLVEPKDYQRTEHLR